MIKDLQICFDFTDRSEESFKMGEGGPAVCDGKLHGIFSWNNKKSACGEDRVVGVFTRPCYSELFIIGTSPAFVQSLDFFMSRLKSGFCLDQIKTRFESGLGLDNIQILVLKLKA